MKIGYAISTTPKRYDPERDYFENCNGVCHLHNDVKGEGMATAKNRGIKFLYDAGCDYMILMDDDTKILDEQFAYELILAYVNSEVHHFTMPGKGARVTKTKAYEFFDLQQYDKGAGVMLFITREVVERVGFLNVNYPSIWGHAHIGWSIRILKAGLMPGFSNWRVGVKGLEKYFWSDDLHGEPGKENFSKAEKDKAMKANSTEHQRESKGKIYYPYAERVLC